MPETMGAARARSRVANKVAIVALGESRIYVPWTNPEFEFWGCNDAHHYMEASFVYPWSKWFQLHNRPYLEKHWAYGMPAHVRWLREQRALPVYVFNPDEWKDCPTVRKFPTERIWDLTPHGKYHAGSADWQVAYAIEQNFEEIHLYGWGLGPTDSGEPFAAKGCLEYWCGVAEGRGIKVEVHGGSAFHTYHYVKSTRQYGFHDLRNEEDDERTT